ncbi:MAG TPA: GntR family transcriptional regulator [Casimicrobiaceae bacterium]|nr:GntR family transcriptional regulator [Casimicrobiaceae bacterium]
MSAAASRTLVELSATTATRVADELRRRILAGDLSPGQRLKIDDLAELCGVSHMPVREALRELEGEGVLDVHPHRGAVIRGVDRRFIRNFYDVRGAIEALLSERCAERINGETLRSLKRAAEEFEAAGSNDVTSLVGANRRFHEIINATADNPEAVRILAHGRVLADALRVRFGYGRGRVDGIVSEHRALLRHLERRDVAKAGEVARRHCLRARDDLLKQWVDRAASD